MNLFSKRIIQLISKKIIVLMIICFTVCQCNFNEVLALEAIPQEEVIKSIQDIFTNRSKAVLKGDTEFIKTIYDTNTIYGTWAYEYEIKKIKYISSWVEKQGVKFTDINPSVFIRKIQIKGDRCSAYLLCLTEYKYTYENQPEKINTSSIATYHTIQLLNKDGSWIINKEWYKDPFADSLNLSNLKVDSIKEYISNQGEREFSNMEERRRKAVEYVEKYCGAAAMEKDVYRYNKKYRDYNPRGGDCANFASQALFEGAKFKKNTAWNYDGKGATRAWLNADGFKNYMLYSGRGSLIAYGNYEKVYKASYKLLPGDFVAYEKKGDVTHISVVTGADSKGYSLVSCHNTDRYRVPWDLGFSDKDIRFWLVRVHY